MQVNSSTAFRFARDNKFRFFRLPKGHPRKIEDKFIWQSNSDIDGLKEAPRLWHSCLHNLLTQKQFTTLETKQCIYVNWKKGKPQIILLYVDDMLIGSADLQTCKDICASLDKRFKLKASSDVASFLGLELLFQDGLLHIHQRNKINELATHFNIVHGVNVDYPMKDNVDLDTGQSALLEEVEPNGFPSTHHGNNKARSFDLC